MHHQHIHYFSVQSFKKLIEDFGFELITYNLDSHHYGTLQACLKENKKGSIEISDYVDAYKIIENYETYKEVVNSAEKRISSINNDFSVLRHLMLQFLVIIYQVLRMREI